MCGRYVLEGEADELIVEFDADAGDWRDWSPSWNIAPTSTVPVVVQSARDGGRRRIAGARWSLVPSWSTTLAPSYPTFNARSETVAEKPSFAASLRSTRALVPASEYYEWRTQGRGDATPHYIHPTGDAPIAFAGLYSWWRDRGRSGDDPDRWVLTATILTMDAVPSLAHIHDRTPVTLPRDFWDEWLDPGVVGDAALVVDAVAAARPVADALRLDEVGPVRGDSPELTRPLV